MKSGDFYNRVFTSNRVLNTTTVQPVIRPAKIENGEKNEFIVQEKLKDNNEKGKFYLVENNLEEKYNSLEKAFSELKERIEFLENKLNEEKENEENVVEFELQEFDKIIEKESDE